MRLQALLAPSTNADTVMSRPAKGLGLTSCHSRQIRVSRSLEGGGERPARGYGESEAGAINATIALGDGAACRRLRMRVVIACPTLQVLAPVEGGSPAA